MTDSMTAAQAVRAIRRPVFTTREIAALRRGSTSATSQSLRILDEKGLVRRVARGIWCVPDDPRFSPYSLVPLLAGGHRAYVSLISALHLHGLIEQIPQDIFAVTTGPTRTKTTPIATYAFHRIHPEFFVGFDWYGNRRDFLIATPEKALVDALYLSSRKGKRFGLFPEIEFEANFNFDKAADWAHRIPHDEWTREFVLRRLEVIENARTTATQ